MLSPDDKIWGKVKNRINDGRCCQCEQVLSAMHQQEAKIIAGSYQVDTERENQNIVRIKKSELNIGGSQSDFI
jgi:hypothetical protein